MKPGQAEGSRARSKQKNGGRERSGRLEIARAAAAHGHPSEGDKSSRRAGDRIQAMAAIVLAFPVAAPEERRPRTGNPVMVTPGLRNSCEVGRWPRPEGGESPSEDGLT